MKIFAKLFLLLIVISAIPLVLTATIVMEQSGSLQRTLLAKNAETGEKTSAASQKALREQTERTLRQIVQEKASQLETFFENLRRAVLLESALIDHCLSVDPPKHAPPIYTADQVADGLLDPASDFARNVHAKKAYMSYHLAPGVTAAAVDETLTRIRPLGYFFAHNQRALPWCTSTYLGHEDGFIAGYPGRSRYKAEYDPRKRPWYLKSAEARHLVWTDLYLDRNGKDLVITCADPVYDESGKDLRAVAAIDVKLTQIVDQLFDLRSLPVSDAILLDRDGWVRVSAAYDANSAASISSQSTIKPPPVAEFQGGVFARVFEAILAHPEREMDIVEVAADPGTGGEGTLFGYAKIRIVGDENDERGSLTWYYVIKTPIGPIIEPVRRVQGELEVTRGELSAAIHAQVKTLWIQILALMAVVLLLALGIAYGAARATARPLVRMAEVAQRIGKGDLEQKVEVTSRDEIGLMGQSINEMIKGLKERDFVKSTFKRYVTASVVDQLIKDPDRIKLGGERREMTVFFSDLAGFTSISEGMSPEELVSVINEYLGVMTDAIFAAEGTVDKYEGDAIVAFWNAPLDQPDHATRACRAALDNLARLRVLQADWVKRGLPRVDMRIGLNTGAMVVGNMGSSVKINYTVMGDSVNLGSRLEGANKSYGTRVMISESTRRSAGEAIVARELDFLAVKGKSQAVRVYELVGLAGDLPAERVAGYRAFEEGLAAYRERRWDDADVAFRRAIEILGEDPPSEVFLERTFLFRLEPPPDDWDGTYVLKTK